MTFRRLKDSNVTKTIKRFRLKIKTKTKSKMCAKMNTDWNSVVSVLMQNHVITNVTDYLFLCRLLNAVNSSAMKNDHAASKTEVRYRYTPNFVSLDIYFNCIMLCRDWIYIIL